MKYLFAMFIFGSSMLSAQDTTMITVPKSSLTKSQLYQAEVSSAGKWAGLGAEIGAAVNSSLKAVTDQTARFADTKVGNITIFIVVWKIIGKNILGVLFASIILCVGFPILVWSYRKYLPHTIVIKETIDEKKNVIKEYKLIDGDQDGSVKFVHALGAIALLGVMALSLFGS